MSFTVDLKRNRTQFGRLNGWYPTGTEPKGFNVEIDRLTTSDGSPILTGTCTEDLATIDISVAGRSYSTASLGGEWTVPANPLAVAKYTAIPYNENPTYQYVAIQGLYNHPDGDIVMLYSRSLGHVVSNTGFEMVVRTSSDNGVTWSADKVVPQIATTYPRGNGTYGVTPTGRIVMIETTRNFEGDATVIQNAFLRYSDDKGTTWSTAADIKGTLFPNSNFYVSWQSIIDTPAGLMAMFYGSNGNKEVRYSLSTDNGATWSTMSTVATTFPEDINAEPSAVYLGNGRIVLMTRGAASKHCYVKGTATAQGITWEAPVGVYNTGDGATAGSPVSCLVNVNGYVYAAWSTLKSPDPKQYLNKVLVDDFWANPFIIFTQTTFKEEVQSFTGTLNGISNWGYCQMCEVQDSVTSEQNVLCAWWEEAVSSTTMNMLMQSYGGGSPFGVGIYPVTVTATSQTSEVSTKVGTLVIG